MASGDGMGANALVISRGPASEPPSDTSTYSNHFRHSNNERILNLNVCCNVHVLMLSEQRAESRDAL